MPYSHFKWDIPTSQATDKTEKKNNAENVLKYMNKMQKF